MHQSGLGIQVSAFLRHQFQVVVRGQRAVLDLGASGEGCGADGISVSVHKRAQALLLCFVTGRVQLLLRKSQSTALADGLATRRS